MLEENRRLHKLMTEGVDVEYYSDDGTLTAGKVSLINEALAKQGIQTTSSSISNAIHRLQAQKLVKGDPDYPDRWICIELANKEGPADDAAGPFMNGAPAVC